MEHIDFELIINPVAKGRPRTKFINGQALTYTPTRTKEAEDEMRKQLNIKFRDIIFPKHIPVKLLVIFFREKSKYLPKRESLPFRKPDIINFGSMACDVMNDIIYYDDCQVTSCLLFKRWTDREYGYVKIHLEEDNADYKPFDM